MTVSRLDRLGEEAAQLVLDGADRHTFVQEDLIGGRPVAEQMILPSPSDAVGNEASAENLGHE